MPPKHFRSVTDVSTDETTVISDIWESCMFLAPNDSSPATIGIHSCLVRYCEYEHSANIFYQKVISGLQPKDFLHRLNEIEKTLKDDCQLDIERCPMIARLRQYLENNAESFKDILIQIQKHLQACMRDDLLIVPPQTYDQLTQKCIERNQLAFNYDQAHRMRRFQFHNHNEANQPISLINLQKITLSHFKLLVENIQPDAPNRNQLLSELKDLLNNSFFIIKHPSPPIVTCSPPKDKEVTAKINCRLLCLLNISSPQITIDNITPYVCDLSNLNQMHEPDVYYQQSPIDLKTYAISTTPNSPKIFSCADFSKIVLNEISAIRQTESLSTGKQHYAPYVYRIDYYINITINFPNDPTPYHHCVIKQSAPFGLITNASQSADLFAEVFLEDLKSWKPLSTIPNDTTSSSTTKNLTNPEISDIAQNIKRYFIYKTGIQPKYWVIPYIEQELNVAYNKDQVSADKSFHNVLAKILAQIDFMAEHPLLILLHDDGFFFGICDSNQVEKFLRNECKRCEKSICAIRFGSIHNMPKAKDIRVRVDFLGKSSTVLQYYTFEPSKLSMELGLFIIKIALCQASCFENVLYNDTTNLQQQLHITSTNMRIFVNLYDSEKLRKLCPHEPKYTSIWANFDNKENNNSRSSSSSPNFTSTMTTGAYYSYNTNMPASNQSQQVMQSPNLQYLQQQQYSQILSNSQLLQPQHYSKAPIQVQPPYPICSTVPQSFMASSNTPQNNQEYINPAPEIIVITSNNQCMMSPEQIIQLISCNFPQFSSSIQSNRIHHLNLNPPSQSFNTSQSTSLSSGQSTIYETYTTDPTNFPESNNDN